MGRTAQLSIHSAAWGIVSELRLIMAAPLLVAILTGLFCLGRHPAFGLKPLDSAGS